MKKRLCKRLLVTALSAAMVFGTCGTSLAAAGTDTAAAGETAVSAAAEAEESSETVGKAVSTEDADAVSFAEAADAQAQAAEDETVSAAATLDVDSDGYYLITSGDDMDAFNEIVQSDTDANARLTQDITLNADYVPIGTASLMTSSSSTPAYAYEGTFDGQGYTIYGLSISGSYYYAGLFASVTSGCVIKDFTLEGSVTGLGYLAGVAAYAAGSVTIQNITSNVNVTCTSSSAAHIGGILGYAKTSLTANILACENTGTITASGNYAGGIAGDINSICNIAGCRNTGAVTAASYVGGIIGREYNNANYNSTQSMITGCANTGDITATYAYVGGISGYTYGIVQYCFNTGKITTGGTVKSNNGGIVGYQYGYSTTVKGLIDSCFNAGTFDNSTGYFGGIAGATTTYYNRQSITNCYNTADVGSSSIARAGGIMYTLYYSMTFENCYNIGTVTATTYCGDLFGYPSSSSAMSNVSNCYYLSSSGNEASGRGNSISGAAAVSTSDLQGAGSSSSTYYLGSAYKEDSSGINGGYPILAYQDLTVKEVKALFADIDLDTSDLEDIGYAYAAYYCLNDEDQARVFGALADTLTVTKTVSATDTNGYALTSDLRTSISDASYTFTLYKADDTDGTNAAAVASVSYVLEDASGTQTEYVTGTDGSFILKDGETAIFGGEFTATLGTAIDMDTAGYYYIAESDAGSGTTANYETSWTQTTAVSDTVVADASGRTSSYVPVAGGSDNIDEVTFACTNTYVQDMVSVAKIVSDTYVSSALYDELNGDSYTFTLYKTEDGTKSAAAGLSYTVYEDGTAGSTLTTGDDGSFTLTGGQTARFFGVDLDSAVTYSVEETAPAGNWTTSWAASSSVENASVGTDGNSVTVTGSAETGDTIDFTCTNTYLADTLTVTKKVAETAADDSALNSSMLSYLNHLSFSFILYASETALAGESYSVYEEETLVSTGNVTGTDGSFTLTGGQTAVFESLDMTGEVSYSVTETGLDSSLWSTGWSAVTSDSTEAVTSGTASSESISLTGTAASADTIDFTCTNTYASDSVLIYTLDDLVAFSETVADGYYPDATVMADIDATKTATDGSSLEPVGGALGVTDSGLCPNAYTGTFEGNNHTITVDMEQDTDTYYTGLFGGLGEGGVIRNLTLKGTVSGGAYNGGIVAYATGGTIQNVTNEAAVSATNGGRVGGIAGYSTSSALQIIDCVNSGAVTDASGYCGGILGQGYAVISGCTNNGPVTAASYCGGIVGYGYTVISDCINNGAVTTSGSTCGGIAGYLVGASCSISSCFNYGAISGTYILGGIVGNCYAATLQYCGNNGTVTSNSAYTSNYSGGVAGYISGTSTVDSCYNKAAVSGGNRNGGVVGYLIGTSSNIPSVTNCYNTGSISSESAYAGGVIAYLYYNATLKNCYNAGALSTASTADTTYLGGVAATLSTDSDVPTKISNNYALNTVSSAAAYYNENVTEDMMQLVDAAVLKTYATETTDADGNTTESVLGSAYKEDTASINGGYPILTWEYHTYAASWTWAEDYSSATLTLTDTDSSDTQTVEATVTSEVTTAATCTEEGVRTYTATATYEGVEYTDTKTEAIAATGHTYGLPSYTWADDYSSVTATFTCSVCDDVQTVTATNITSETTAATCTETGLITYTATVTFEGAEHTATTSVVLEATGHSYALTGFTWADDYATATATFTCVNDATHTETVEATVTSEVTTAATCTAEGVRTYTATVTFNDVEYTDTATEAIAATGHTYGLPAFTWADDCSSVTAAFTCSVCDDVQTVTTTDITSETTAATCTETGLITYTATVTFEGTEHTATTSIILEATGHSYALTGFTWSDDYASATATFTCANDATHTETLEATVTSEVTTAASCTAEGVRTYTATATYEGATGTDTATETIEKIAHSYESVVTEPTCTEGGYTTYTCSVCGDTYTADETEANGHSYEAVVTEPTCTEGGYTTYTCSVCGDTYTADETAATGHSYEAVVTEPTCTKGGYTTYTCSVCGDTYTADETEATGHSYGSDGYCTVCGAYSAEAAAAAVIELIDAIGDVTTESSDAIAAARAAYNALLESDPEAAALVTNADTLEEAEETYTALTTEDTSGGGTAGGGTTVGSSYTVPSSKIAAEKVSLTGATVAQVTQTLAKLTNDGDLADSTYYLLQAKAKKTTKKSVKLSWKKVSGAASYVVYANACGKGKKLKKYKVTSKTSLNITKIAGKKLTSGKYYKFLVIALDADGKVIQTSKVIHAATKGGSVTNAKSVTLYKSGKKITSLTLKKGKSAKIKAKVTKQNKKKKIKNHRKTTYESSNKKIAAVNKNGKITAKSKGTCYIYAYAQNGVCKKIKVTVK